MESVRRRHCAVCNEKWFTTTQVTTAGGASGGGGINTNRGAMRAFRTSSAVPIHKQQIRGASRRLSLLGVW